MIRSSISFYLQKLWEIKLVLRTVSAKYRSGIFYISMEHNRKLFSIFYCPHGVLIKPWNEIFFFTENLFCEFLGAIEEIKLVYLLLQGLYGCKRCF